MLLLCLPDSWPNSAHLWNATLGKYCESWTKRSHVYTGDRCHVLNLQTSKRGLKSSHECTTHLLASLLHAPFPRKGTAAAAGCKHWAVMLEHPQGAKALVSQVCSTRCLRLGWLGGAKAFHERKFPKSLDFTFFTFSLHTEGGCHCQIYRPHLLRSMAGGRHCSSFFQWDKFSGWALNCSCMSVGGAACACFSCDQQQGGRPTEVTAAPRGMAGSHRWSWGGHARNSQISEMIGGECWGLLGNKVL